jgi:hypothetical protein
LDQFSPRQSRPHFKIASIAAAGASQSEDRNDKQKTGFFDSIDPLPSIAVYQSDKRNAGNYSDQFTNSSEDATGG